MKKHFFFTALIVFVCSALSAQTERINFTAPFQYPEGVVFNKAKNLFYVSSARTGSIGSVNMEGKYDSIYVDSSLKSSYGLKIDEKNQILWACTGNPTHSKYVDSATFKKMIRLIAIDLKTNKKIKDIDLSAVYNGKHFLNDVVLDDKGNLYATDSYSPVIYKVDASGTASLFAESPLFKGADVGLNGIALHPSGTLLVANNSTGALLAVNVSDPTKVTPVKIDHFFPGADGLLWDEKGNLVLIQNKGSNMIYQLSSTDQWKSARITASTKGTDRFAQPSTGTVANGKVYVLNSKLNELKDPTMQPSKEFSLQVARFVNR